MGQRLVRVRDWFLVPLLEKPVQVFVKPAQLRDCSSHGRLRTYPGVADAVLQARSSWFARVFAEIGSPRACVCSRSNPRRSSSRCNWLTSQRIDSFAYASA